MKKPIPFTATFYGVTGDAVDYCCCNNPNGTFTSLALIAHHVDLITPPEAVRVVIDIALHPTEVSSHA